ncbi:DUF1294 domain-containing protein [Inediibacterium massiliense]|uniref:DUF1294 domain-containing protein n=1 Tax=Inediibacterium massiliense TaxID=1658111 RepID=UPI0018FEBC29|nr:DUF1294 domain-containing protein [Inediibacterium massiliense]
MDHIKILLKMKEFYFIIYLILINIYSFLLTFIDKYKSKKDGWRIRERTFFIVSFFGGAVGVMIGMSIFRHKTQHKSFYIGIPFIYLLHIVGILFWLYRKAIS